MPPTAPTCGHADDRRKMSVMEKMLLTIIQAVRSQVLVPKPCVACARTAPTSMPASSQLHYQRCRLINALYKLALSPTASPTVSPCDGHGIGSILPRMETAQEPARRKSADSATLATRRTRVANGSQL